MPNDQAVVTSLAGKTVVLIENESITMIYLRKLLSRAGLNVVGEAATGREGIRFVEQHEPDMVLLDTGLPDMDVTQVSRTLRGHPSCLVLLTHLSEEMSDRMTVQSGANGYINKPASRDLILARLEQICGSHKS